MTPSTARPGPSPQPASRTPAALHGAWRALVLLAVLAAALLADPPAFAQDNGGRLAELRGIVALRDAQQADQPAQVRDAAQTYLKDFPEGRYHDEALLALAEAQSALGSPDAALAAYDRLITEHPDSPFREQALAESLPLLQAAGEEELAAQRVATLVKEYPNSLHRDRALLWQGEQEFQAGRFKDAAGTLQRVREPEGLGDERLTDYYRLLALSLLQSGQSAWTPLKRYLERPDTPERKAGVLMRVGRIAREAGRDEEALSYYRRLVDDFPVPEHLPAALYWRAELYRRVKVDAAEGMERIGRVPEAIAFYSAYLLSEDDTHAVEALLQRASLRQELDLTGAALEDYQAAIARDPSVMQRPEVLLSLVNLYVAEGKAEHALALLREVQRNEAVSQDVKGGLQIEVAGLFYEREQCDQVEALLDPMPLFQQAERRQRASFMRGFCRYRSGQWEQATFDLEGLINDPAYLELVREPLLDAYEQSGQFSRLAHMTEELLRAERVEPSAPVLKRLARAYDALGEPVLMLDAYKRLAEHHPDAVETPEVQLRMGRAQAALGHTDEAVPHLERVLALVEEADTQPVPPAYLEAVVALQEAYLNQGNDKALADLLERAQRTLEGDEEALARLSALQRQARLAAGKAALESGDAAKAVQRLGQAWENTPETDSEARLALLPLLVQAHARNGTLDQGLEAYKAERKRSEDDEYRAALADATLPPLLAPERLDSLEHAQQIALLETALADLPHENTERRMALGERLDGLYAEDDDFARRAALATELLKDGLSADQRDAIKDRKRRIYLDWGRHLAEGGDTEAAIFHYERAMDLASDAEWRARYEIASAMSNALLKERRHSEVVLLNERLLPDIEDEKLAAQVRHFLGQVYVDWGRAAEEEENWKSARIRYRYALDYLPQSDWQRRVAAANGLAKALQQLERPADAAEAYAEVVPTLPEGETRQQYALYLGRLYHEKVGAPDKARKWLQMADTGGNDSISLEAGYLLAELQLAANDSAAARKRLAALADRGLEGSKWRVPIHYRLAVLLHQQQQLKQALRHYRIVADESSPELRKLYPRSIAQSRKVAAQIADYLEASGGNAGNVAVPQVRPQQ